MGKYDLDEVHERIEEVSAWKPSTEKSMAMAALENLLLARQGQIEYKPGIFLETDQLRLPNFWERLIGLCWLEYDDTNVFDGSRRINLVNGETESSPMKRRYGYDPCHYDLLDLEELLEFIRKVGDQEEAEG